MSSISMKVNVADWDSIKGRFARGGLLLGNGASLAVWDGFRYPSLFDVAQREDFQHRLSDKDLAIFQDITERYPYFEMVLCALWTTKVVNSRLNLDTKSVLDRYRHMQNALAEAVNKIPAPPYLVVGDTGPLELICEAPRFYRYVFTTNYDLLVCWAMMTKKEGFIDCFWHDSRWFHRLDTRQPWGWQTAILYLHGALHLLRYPSGSTSKQDSSPGASLLDQFGWLKEDGSTPLFVAEGRAEDKLTAIQGSGYLSFAYERFAHHNGTLVVFGQSLQEEVDGHLIAAIKEAQPTQIAFSVHETHDEWTLGLKAATLIKQLDRSDIIFFDAKTHPLGDAALKVKSDV